MADRVAVMTTVLQVETMAASPADQLVVMAAIPTASMTVTPTVDRWVGQTAKIWGDWMANLMAGMTTMLTVETRCASRTAR